MTGATGAHSAFSARMRGSANGEFASQFALYSTGAARHATLDRSAGRRLDSVESVEYDHRFRRVPSRVFGVIPLLVPEGNANVNASENDRVGFGSGAVGRSARRNPGSG
jgi:hypothetical protein